MKAKVKVSAGPDAGSEARARQTSAKNITLRQSGAKWGGGSAPAAVEVTVRYAVPEKLACTVHGTVLEYPPAPAPRKLMKDDRRRAHRNLWKSNEHSITSSATWQHDSNFADLLPEDSHSQRVIFSTHQKGWREAEQAVIKKQLADVHTLEVLRIPGAANSYIRGLCNHGTRVTIAKIVNVRSLCAMLGIICARHNISSRNRAVCNQDRLENNSWVIGPKGFCCLSLEKNKLTY